MHSKTTKLFLAQSHAESNILLQDAIHSKKAVFWDNILITAATQAQADIYQHLIKDRIARRFLPSKCDYLVQPDRDGVRIGSGGATLCALARLYKDCSCDINKLISKKNLLLHSGGAAKRLPHSAPWGKLFAFSGSHINDDIKNPPGTVFDDLVTAMAGLPTRMSGGVIVVAADAFFRFNHTQFDLNISDTVAFSTKASVETGTVHGVYLHKDGFVDRFLHKLPEKELYMTGAVSETGEVDLDIGITYLGENAISALLGLILDGSGKINEEALSKYANERVNLSLYGDLIYPMAKFSKVEDFLKQDGDGPVTQDLQNLRPEIFNALHSTRLKIFRLSPGAIRSMGTTEEAFESLTFFKDEAWLKGNLFHDMHIALNSSISDKAIVNSNYFIEDSRIPEGVKIGSGALVSGCDLYSGFAVPDNTALHSVMLKSGKWICRFWGIHDDVKAKKTWLGRPLADWDPEADSLWNAKLFPLCGSQREALDWAKNFFVNNVDINKWQAIQRLSLSDIEEIDIEGLLNRRNEREDIFRAEAFALKVLNGSPAAEALRYLGNGMDASNRINLLKFQLEEGQYKNWQDKMRLYLCISESAKLLGLDLDAGSMQEKGFAALREASVKLTPIPHPQNLKWQSNEAEIYLPARVNWGGSWSDAPPYSFERGGTMLNAAVTMDGKLPIYASAQRISEPFIEMVSQDLGMEAQFQELAPLLMYRDPADPFILFKSALKVSGIISEDGTSLKEQLKKMGGGVRISTRVDIPKGSGLGTSSILTGALINVLTKLSGRTRSLEELTGYVVVAEQLMTTGGGWQDPIGGMFPGIKLTLTEPGIPQKYDIQQVHLSEAAYKELNTRGFLLYTGQRRLAKSALQRVLSRYICNCTDSIAAFQEIQRLAFSMVFELRRGNISNFGELLTEHTNMMKRLDPSSSNLMLDHLTNELSDFLDGSTICGAGGGGFLYGILKNHITLDNVRQWLKEKYEGTAIRLHTSQITR